MFKIEKKKNTQIFLGKCFKSTYPCNGYNVLKWLLKITISFLC